MSPVTSPVPGDGGAYRRQTIRIPDLTLVSDLLLNLRFEECLLIGPAILVPLGDTTIAGSQFDAPGPDALFWPIDEDRTEITGAIAAQSCEFHNCRFQRIGIGVPRSQMALYLKGFGMAD
jgi:hypothetical protein